MDSFYVAWQQILEMVERESGVTPTRLKHQIVFDCETGRQKVDEYAFIGAFWSLINEERIQFDQGRVYLVVPSTSNG